MKPNLNDLLDAPGPKPSRCQRCGGPDECEIWETPVCYRCAADWSQRSPPTNDATKLRDFTAAWVGESKQGAA